MEEEFNAFFTSKELNVFQDSIKDTIAGVPKSNWV